MNVRAARPQAACLDDAAYLLGALGPDERAAFEVHLHTCSTCTDSLVHLAGLPGLLSRVPRKLVIAVDGGSAAVRPAALLPSAPSDWLPSIEPRPNYRHPGAKHGHRRRMWRSWRWMRWATRCCR